MQANRCSHAVKNTKQQSYMQFEKLLSLLAVATISNTDHDHTVQGTLSQIAASSTVTTQQQHLSMVVHGITDS